MAGLGTREPDDESMNWFVSLSLANDERILPAVRGVAEAAARQARFESAEVERIACAVAGAAQAAMLASRGHGPTIDLWFELRARQFEVRLKVPRCRAGTAGRHRRWPHGDGRVQPGGSVYGLLSGTDAALSRESALMHLYNTLTRREEPFTPARAETVRMYTCGLTVYNRGHIGNFRTFVCVDVLRRDAEVPTGLPRAAGHELHRRGRSHHRRRAEGRNGRCASTPISSSRCSGRTPRRSGSSRSRRRRARPTRRTSRRWRQLVRELAGQRPHLHQRRLGVLQDRDASRVRQAGAAGPRGHQAGRARRRRQLRQGRRARLRAVEGRPGRGSRPGTSASARAGPAGTSSARRWRCACSANRPSTSTRAASTWSSPITRTRSRRARGRRGSRSSRFWFHCEHLILDEQKMSKSLGNVFTVQDVLGARHPAVGAAVPAAVDPLPQAAEVQLGEPAAGRRGASGG